MPPLISVIIPTYNNAKMVFEAIESVLKQTYKDYELIVVDDGSTDETSEIVKQYGASVKYIYQQNSHISSARNNGFNHSKGNYIAQLDADDLWLPEKLELQAELIDKHPEAGLFYCDAYICNKGDEENRSLVYSQNYVPPKEGNVFKYFFQTNPLCTSSAIISRKAWFDLKGLDTDLRGGQDTEFFIRISAFYQVYYVNKPLMIYRRHENNSSSKITKNNIIKAFKKNILQRHIAIKNIKKYDINLPLCIKIFDLSPEFIQYVLLFYWRLKFTPNKMYSLKFAAIYTARLIERIIFFWK
jgi:glycosyltransferase involved in cell wall biosynthesis